MDTCGDCRYFAEDPEREHDMKDGHACFLNPPIVLPGQFANTRATIGHVPVSATERACGQFKKGGT